MFITIHVPGLQLPEGVTGIQLLPDTLNVSGGSISNMLQPVTDGNLEKKSGQKKTRKISQVSKTVSSGAGTDWFLDYWNGHATKHKWGKIELISLEVKGKLDKLPPEFRGPERWEAVMRGMLADPFFSGSSGEYKPRPLTLLYKNRYMDFYNAGLALNDAPKGTSDILADWGAKLESVVIPTLPLPMVMPDDADKDS